MPFQIVQGDITKMETDAIVNAANSGLQRGGGVCGAIFAAAGGSALQRECDEKAPCPVGEAVITGGYNLKAKHIIHAVGPIWKGGNQDEEKHLRSAYLNSLRLAEENGLSSISFPLISSGIYGYPKDRALAVARHTIEDFLQDSEMLVNLVIFNRKDMVLEEEVSRDLEELLSFHSDEHVGRMMFLVQETSCAEAPRSLEDLMKEQGESFSEMLLRLITEKGLSDVEVYKRANLDRKHFSKIRSRKDYQPKKQTVLALAIALHLSLEETEDLLESAGYAFSGANKGDIIIKYFIQSEGYNIFLINEALFYYEQNPLGA